MLGGDCLKLLVFAPSFEPAVKAGGPARSLTNLVGEVSRDISVDVVAPDRDLGDSEAFIGLSGRRVSRGSTTVYYLNTRSTKQWFSLIRRLSRTQYDLIMVNGWWNVKLALLPTALKLSGVLRGPILQMPRGELDPGALALKASKKTFAKPFFVAIYRRGVYVVGATSDLEAAQVRSVLPGKLILMTSNTPDAIPWGAPQRPGPPLRVVFLSRVSPKKGLLPLLQGLREVAHRIHLTIVGPSEDPAYWSECYKAISKLPPHVEVHRVPLASREDVPEILWNADCLILLTAGENYGHVIAEALQAGCPVLATPNTPWTDILREGGGEIITDRDDPGEVATALDRWAMKSPDELLRTRYAARRAFDDFSSKLPPNVIEMALGVLGDVTCGRLGGVSPR